MIQLRPSAERGYADHGWLRARHSFSFADYYDPAEMGWGALRVINEDRVAPGAGFGRHGHRDMEIVTYILSGALEHKDSLGSGGVIRRGEVQRMTAGKGILHSEFNPSADEETHLLQIWIEPAQRGTPASYEQQARSLAARRLAGWRRGQHDDRSGCAPVGQRSRAGRKYRISPAKRPPGLRAGYLRSTGNKRQKRKCRRRREDCRRNRSPLFGE